MERTKITALFNMNFSDYHLTIKYIQDQLMSYIADSCNHVIAVQL
jgi:hypothetical protein